MDASLRCKCGHLRGIAGGLSPSSGFRVRCFCKDCQAFAHFLDRSDLLDAGGLDIFQMPPARVELTSGIDTLRCLRLSEKGVFRWYASCCGTPVANTSGPRVPLVGMYLCLFDRMTDGRPADGVIGPLLCGIYLRSAPEQAHKRLPDPPSRALMFRRSTTLLRWWIAGLNRPNPFFHEVTNAPRSAPRVLTAGERSLVYGS